MDALDQIEGVPLVSKLLFVKFHILRLHDCQILHAREIRQGVTGSLTTRLCVIRNEAVSIQANNQFLLWSWVNWLKIT